MSAYICHILRRGGHGLHRILTKRPAHYFYPSCKFYQDSGQDADGLLTEPSDHVYDESDDYFGLGNLKLNRPAFALGSDNENFDPKKKYEKKIDKSDVFEKHDLRNPTDVRDGGVLSLPYGSVRFDTVKKVRPTGKTGARATTKRKSDNDRSAHGSDCHLDEIVSSRLSSKIENTSNEKRLFVRSELSDNQHIAREITSKSNPSGIKATSFSGHDNVIEEHFFPGIDESGTETRANLKSSSRKTCILHKNNGEKSDEVLEGKNFIEEHYFSDHLNNASENVGGASHINGTINPEINSNNESGSFVYSDEGNLSNFMTCNEELGAVSRNQQICSNSNLKTDLNYVDEQYFKVDEVSSHISQKQSDKSVKIERDYENLNEPLLTKETDLNYIDQQYMFGNHSVSDRNSNSHGNLPEGIFSTKEGYKKVVEDSVSDLVEDSSLVSDRNDIFHKSYTHESPEIIKPVKESVEYISKERNKNLTAHENMKVVENEGNTKSKQREKLRGGDGRQTLERISLANENNRLSRRDPRSEKPTSSAYRHAMEIRNTATDKGVHIHGIPEKMLKRDSSGFLILRDQVPHFESASTSEIVDTLLGGVLYDQDDVVAINKPYGLACQPGSDVGFSISEILDKLARGLDRRLDTLHTVHRLDRNTTGVYLLAKTEVVAARLRAAFKNREVIKKYWVLTCGVPAPKQGVIDIPLSEGTVGKKARIVCMPGYTAETKLVMRKPSVETHKAVTHYRVLRESGNCALVECKTETGVKHQIRSHLFFALNTPILGDHKYSHLTKFAPQRIPTDILHKLQVRQSKARYVPMHLHAKSILIPEFLEGRNFYVKCRLPRHFSDNMRKVKINPPLHG